MVKIEDMSYMITTDVVAERLNLSLERVRQLIAESRLPAEKVGRIYLVDERVLSNFTRRPAGRPRKQGTKKPARKATRKASTAGKR